MTLGIDPEEKEIILDNLSAIVWNWPPGSWQSDYWKLAGIQQQPDCLQLPNMPVRSQVSRVATPPRSLNFSPLHWWRAHPTWTITQIHKYREKKQKILNHTEINATVRCIINIPWPWRDVTQSEILTISHASPSPGSRSCSVGPMHGKVTVK
jgi:hypothetical protein